MARQQEIEELTKAVDMLTIASPAVRDSHMSELVVGFKQYENFLEAEEVSEIEARAAEASEVSREASLEDGGSAEARSLKETLIPKKPKVLPQMSASQVLPKIPTSSTTPSVSQVLPKPKVPTQSTTAAKQAVEQKVEKKTEKLLPIDKDSLRVKKGSSSSPAQGGPKKIPKKYIDTLNDFTFKVSFL